MERKKYDKPITQEWTFSSESLLNGESMLIIIDENGDLVIDNPDEAYSKSYKVSVWD